MKTGLNLLEIESLSVKKLGPGALHPQKFAGSYIISWVLANPGSLMGTLHDQSDWQSHEGLTILLIV